MVKPRDTKNQVREEEDEGFELIIDKRHKFHGNILTINSNLGRIVLSSQLYAYTTEKYGKDFTHVQLLMSYKSPGIFLIQPCDKGTPGARGVHLASGSRVISAKLLLQKMKWKSKGGEHFTAEWVEKPAYKALRVDVGKPLEM